MKDPWSKCLDRLFWVTVETGKYNVVECRTVVSGDYTQKNPTIMNIGFYVILHNF